MRNILLIAAFLTVVPSAAAFVIAAVLNRKAERQKCIISTAPADSFEIHADDTAYTITLPEKGPPAEGGPYVVAIGEGGQMYWAEMGCTEQAGKANATKWIGKIVWLLRDEDQDARL